VGYNGCGHVTVAGQTLTPNSNLSVTKVIEVRSFQICCVITVTTWSLLVFNLPQWLQVGYLCNNAHIEDGSLFGQPTEGALIAVALKVTINRQTDRQTSRQTKTGRQADRQTTKQDKK